MAFGRWCYRAFGATPEDLATILKQLCKGRSYTFVLSELEEKYFLRHAAEWGLTGVSRHDGDIDLSEYFAPSKSFLKRWLQRLRVR